MPMVEGQIVVFDIGGTASRAGIFDVRERELLRTVRATTPSFLTHPGAKGVELRSMLYRVMRSLAARLDADDPATISIAFPGPVDADGVALRAPTLWGCDDDPEPVAARAQEIWPSADILVSNDLSASGFGFLKHETEDLCAVTVSSGVGHKVFLGGLPVVGARGRGGEIGHTRVDFSDEAPICDCGGRGHLSAVASGRAIRNQALRLARQDFDRFRRSHVCQAVSGDLSRVDNRVVAQAFRAGDPWTMDLIAKIAQPLGRVLATIHATVGVERFVVTGGIAHALGPEYLRLMARAATASEWALGQNWEEMLELGRMGDDAGLFGAGLLAARFMTMSCRTGVRSQ